MKNLATVEAYLPQLRQRIVRDARFKGIQVWAYTGLDGAVGVGGWVPSEESLAELKKMVESTAPPRPVYWTVKVDTNE
jgi:hypothetical protein